MNKYRAKKTTVDGITFDSKKEANRYCELKLEAKAIPPVIADLELQPEFDLIGADGNPLKSDAGRTLKYKADFRYYHLIKGCWVIEDSKGYQTPEYKLKKAIMRSMGISVIET